MLTNKTMIAFIGEHDYDQPHTNWQCEDYWIVDDDP
jgi:hypothetical protein